MNARRIEDVDEADLLDGDGWLARRARRKTRENLADAEAKLDREIERTIDERGLRPAWDDFDAVPDEEWEEIEGLLDP